MNGYAFQTGVIDTPAGQIPKVSSELTGADRFGSFRARFGIGRMRYKVNPGLYAVGNPTDRSPVFISANYKMSFDKLRSNLASIDGWILVLDTHGINVWCAAGKGTFGTDELVKRIEGAKVSEVVSHRDLIVPQFGAVGVSAHEVAKRSGFRVRYGPIRAPDIGEFLGSGMKATPEMRRVEFPLRERLSLIPMEVLGWAKLALIIALVFLILGGLTDNGFSLAGILREGIWGAIIFLGAYLLGAVTAPILLPWLPGRAFALKGVWVGFIAAGGIALHHLMNPAARNGLQILAWALIVPAVTSFTAMNFTGSSTYTSISGVRKEMRFAVPLQIAALVSGFVLWTAGLFK
jgi:acetyl-CoA decarbonylase/synthase complex subunit gamma